MKKLICLALSLLILMSAFPAFALTYDELLQKAADYVGSEEFEKAFACYDLAVKNDPNNATAYIRAGLLHLDRGELSEAGASIENSCFIRTASISQTLTSGFFSPNFSLSISQISQRSLPCFSMALMPLYAANSVDGPISELK